jgi:hypothetical protein
MHVWKLSVFQTGKLRNYFYIDQTHVDEITSNLWLKQGPLVKGFVIAIQDKIINIRYYEKYIRKYPGCHMQTVQSSKQNYKTSM